MTQSKAPGWETWRDIDGRTVLISHLKNRSDGAHMFVLTIPAFSLFRDTVSDELHSLIFAQGCGYIHFSHDTVYRFYRGGDCFVNHNGGLLTIRTFAIDTTVYAIDGPLDIQKT